MEILITGCAGFIGSHLTERLLGEGHRITGIDNFDAFYSKESKQANLHQALQSGNFNFFSGDVRNIQSVIDPNQNKIELVIHLAAKAGVRPSIADPEAYIQHNVFGTQCLLDWMKAAGIRKLVFASSSSVYGNNKKTPFHESDPVDNPISPYAATKKACELINHVYYHLFDFRILNLRFFTVYGPRQRPDLAIHKFFDRIYNEQPIELYGDGSTGRDYTYVDDTVEGITAAAKLVGGGDDSLYEIVNLGNHHPVKLNELVEAIENVTGKKAIRKYMPMQEGDVDITYADISRANKLLGYKPGTTLEEGLENFRRWYEMKKVVEKT